jgi:hypothetical protein
MVQLLKSFLECLNSQRENKNYVKDNGDDNAYMKETEIGNKYFVYGGWVIRRDLLQGFPTSCSNPVKMVQ